MVTDLTACEYGIKERLRLVFMQMIYLAKKKSTVQMVYSKGARLAADPSLATKSGIPIQSTKPYFLERIDFYYLLLLLLPVIVLSFTKS